MLGGRWSERNPARGPAVEAMARFVRQIANERIEAFLTRMGQANLKVVIQGVTR